MKAAVFYGKGDLRVEERKMPKPGKGEILMRVRACGICGTDSHIFNGDEGAGKTPPNTVLGHEFAGEVVGLGEGITGLKPGDRICVDPNKMCGSCAYCLDGIGHFCESMIGIGTGIDGGFAEYCVVPASQAQPFSSQLTFEKAAMTEPVSCCLHGIDMCEILPGSTVAVIGCGMIGLLMLQLAKLRGAAKLIAIEPVESKRKRAMELGADLAIDPINEDVDSVLAANSVGRISTVIECVGRPNTIKDAIRIAGKHSVVMMFGLTAPEDTVDIKPFEVFKKEITLKASFINPYTFRRALALIESGKIDVSSMVYEYAPLEELPAILADPKRRNAGKHIIRL